MCGRIKQGKGEKYHMETLHWNPHRLFTDRSGPRHNVPPGTRPLVMTRRRRSISIVAQKPVV